MRLGRAVHRKGWGSALVSAMKRSMAVSSSATDRNTPRLRRWLVTLAKKPSTALSHEADDGEVEEPARELGKPFAHLRIHVGALSVDDRLDHLRLEDLGGVLLEEADVLLMPMALQIAADDGAVENVERGEQCRRAVALVVVRHRPGAPRLHRQSRLSPVEGLDLALLVDREDDGMGGRVDVETDHIPELFGERRIVRQLERPDTMRRELVGLEDALHRPQADTHRPGQHPASP